MTETDIICLALAWLHQFLPVFNRPGVAGAVQQTALSLIKVTNKVTDGL